MIILKIKNACKQLIGLNDSPFLIALSFGVGAFIGFSPLYGIHTVLGLIAAWAFKLNKASLITGVYLSNPVTIVPIYTFGTWFGIKITGSTASISDFNLKGLTLSNIENTLESLLWPFIIGNTVLSVLVGFISYAILYHILKLRAKSKPVEANLLPDDK
ncbi:MAG: DUF2062 domain-containing protein [Nitrospirae bacterium]|nr:DUF2062 domain-containing protein [Nitrospirota bacterium]MBF0535121.1 DUF2062 domain-containing protein [Nitrospirota bacterium]MBF0615329.1 DUF2062 domain-containing protein [Nitrospirota bacterium]